MATVHKLLINNRAAGDPGFSGYLPTIGDGSRKFEAPGVPEGSVDLLPGMGVDSPDEMIQAVFEGNPLITAAKRAILTPRNSDCHVINDKVNIFFMPQIF